MMNATFYRPFFHNINIMKWNSKVDDKTKDKIELLLKEFDKFIIDSHEGSPASEDKTIVKEWKNFKTLIEKDPTDIESLHSYINSIQEPRIETKPSKSNLTVSRSTSNIRASSKQEIPFEVDKGKLRKVSKDLMDMIMKNNRDALKLESK